MKYLIDSDVLIHLERTRAPALVQRFSRHHGELMLSSIVASELLYGAAKSRESELARTNLMLMFALLEALDFTAGDAEHVADIRFHLHQRGQMIGPNDLLIAGQARARGMVLVTNNTREFERVPGLRVENWVATLR